MCWYGHRAGKLLRVCTRKTLQRLGSMVTECGGRIRVLERPWPDRCSRRCRSCSARRSTASWRSTTSACSARTSWRCWVRWCSSWCTSVSARCRCRRPSATTTTHRRRRLDHAPDRSRSHSDACLHAQRSAVVASYLLIERFHWRLCTQSIAVDDVRTSLTAIDSGWRRLQWEGFTEILQFCNRFLRPSHAFERMRRHQWERSFTVNKSISAGHVKLRRRSSNTSEWRSTVSVTFTISL